MAIKLDVNQRVQVSRTTSGDAKKRILSQQDRRNYQ